MENIPQSLVARAPTMSSNSTSQIQAEPALEISGHFFMVVTTIDNSISKVCIHVLLSTISVLISLFSSSVAIPQPVELCQTLANPILVKRLHQIAPSSLRIKSLGLGFALLPLPLPPFSLPQLRPPDTSSTSLAIQTITPSLNPSLTKFVDVDA